jgi:hypothetical protein
MANTGTQPDLGNSVDTLAKAVERLTARLDSGVPVAATPSSDAEEAARRFRDILRGLELRGPLELVVQATSATAIGLAWTADEPEITPTRLLRCQGVRCDNFDTLADVGAKETSYVDRKVSAETTYRYKITAPGPGGKEFFSIAEATTTKS